MELVSSAIIEPVVNLLTNHITQKLRNLTSSADRVKDMKDKMKVLDGQRIDNENHLRRNRGNNKEVPARVEGWLEEVENIKKEVEKIPSNDIGCFNVKTKYRAGKNALAHIKAIDRLITEEITWTDAVIPLGRVDSKRPTSTSASGGEDQNGFDSRKKIFNDALKLLQEDDDHTARVIALCGMGGVGKTTLMKQLKKAAEDNKMFKWILVAVIGNTPNLFTIQNAIAAHIGEPLTETDETLRASLLSKRFQAFSERKEKSLVILDDVWEKIKLEDIGLASPLPNGVKLLLTSRNVQVCRQIADDPAFEEVKVDVLKENEAQDFFCQKAGISADHVYYEIGCEIVKKCGCLPLAIELIAGTLKGEENRNVWRHSLKCLKNNDLNKNLQEIMEMSYNNLKQEQDKAIFLLCGLFPEDSNIPIEDLTRYAWGLKEAWGLKLLSKVHTIEDARDSTQTSVSNLKKAYLLMDGDSHHSDCVKLHDLVLAFVVATVSKGGEDECWIIHHGDDFSNWSEANSMSQPCKQISLACKGMSEFPSEFLYPNLSLLKLMHGNESLRFPQGIYEVMEKLQVIAFEKLKYPLVPTSFQFSANLRTLCLHECSLMFDLTCIGNLLNLEVLSFANSGITFIPSTFKSLKKLRLLDVTGCYNLVIDDGVLKSLVKLEELYMIPFDEKACCFTDNNNSELAERSKNLCALEFEFIGNNAHMKNVSCEKLKRFKLSVGCSFTEVRKAMHTRQVDTHSYENSLKLITNREPLNSEIIKLFEITDALHLQMNDMNTLPYSSFNNLRLLVVSKCAEFAYLFTRSVATNLSKLEYLEISSCDAMEAVIHTENNGSDIILFSNLKYLRLAGLRKLLCFCNNINVIELPCLMELQLVGLPKITSIYTDRATSFVSSNISPTQSFLNAQDATPKLEKLFVEDCDSIEVLFNMDFSEIEQLSTSLRSIEVDGCNSLVKLFSCNPFPFFNNLLELEVRRCRSIQVLFDIDWGRHGNIGEQVCSSSLRSINVCQCDRLVKLFSCNPFPFINNLQELEVRSCRSIQVLFEIDSGHAGRYEGQDAAPKLEKLFVSDMENLKEIWPPQFNISNLCPLTELTVEDCGSIEVLFNMDFGEIEQRLSSSLRSIEVYRCDSLVKLFSCNPFPFFNNLQELKVRSCHSIQVLFQIDSGRAGRYEEQDAAPKLEKLVVSDMANLKEIWPPQFSISNLCPLRELTVEGCGSIEVLFNMDFGEIEQLSSSLRSIKVSGCDSLVKLFSCSPFPFLNNLQDLKVERCGSIQVLFNTDLGRTGKSEEQVCSNSLRSIAVEKCDSLVNLLPSNPMPLFNNLEELKVYNCASVEVIFDINMGCVGEMDKVSSSRLRSICLVELGKLREVWRIKDAGNNNLIHGFEAIESIFINKCERFENLITPATTNLDMRALKKVEISRCGRKSERKNELVEKEKEISKIAFPSSLLPTFHNLHKLGLYFGYEDVVFEITSPISRESAHNTQQQLIILPNLEELKLYGLEKMSHVWKCNWNEFLILQKQPSQSSFRNLTTIKMEYCDSIKYLFSPLIAKLLSNLKAINIQFCDGIEEVVSNRYDISSCDGIEEEIVSNTDDEDASIYSHTTTTFFPHLDILNLKRLRNFKCIGGGTNTNGISTDDAHDQVKLSQASWSLCQYAREISIKGCDALSSVVPWYAVGKMQNLQVLKIEDCESMTEVFETQEINNKSGTDTGKSLPRLEYITMLKLPKLKILKIQGCNLLKHIFTFSTLESLTQLEELEVKDCKAMEVIVTEENGEQTTASDVVVFPHLKSLILVNLPNFVGFFLGKNEFRWPALENVEIRGCPQMTVFTCGQSTALKLKFINTSLGKHSVECGLNFHVTTSHQDRLPSYETDVQISTVWSYHNLIEVDVYYNPSVGQTLFSSDEVSQLQKLETVHCSGREDIEEIFDSETDAEIPNLRQVKLKSLKGLKYIWKSKQGTVLKFPNLTRLSIWNCDSLEYVFTCPMVGSLLQLQELHIDGCSSMKVVVKGEEDEECDAIVNAFVKFPCLKSLKLKGLWSLEGFCIGKEAFEFPSLDTLQIYDCRKMRVFTKGDLTAPKLYEITNYWGRKFNIHNRLNSVVIKDFTKL